MLKLDFEQAKIKEQEKIKNKKAKKKKIILNTMYVSLVITLLVVAIVALVIKFNKPEVIIDGTEVNLRHVNGKLANLIKGLGNKYTIRYLGEFGPDDWNTDIKEATVEFTKEGENTALYSKELHRNVVTKGEDVYSVVKVLKLVLKTKKPTDFSSKEYNLLSDFGQFYVADVKVKENGVEYIYQEYTYNDVKIRYYFVGEDLRHIKIVEEDKERTISVIIDRNNSKKELFELPKDYTYQNIG